MAINPDTKRLLQSHRERKQIEQRTGAKNGVIHKRDKIWKDAAKDIGKSKCELKKAQNELARLQKRGCSPSSSAVFNAKKKIATERDRVRDNVYVLKNDVDSRNRRANGRRC